MIEPVISGPSAVRVGPVLRAASMHERRHRGYVFHGRSFSSDQKYRRRNENSKG